MRSKHPQAVRNTSRRSAIMLNASFREAIIAITLKNSPLKTKSFRYWNCCWSRSPFLSCCNFYKKGGGWHLLVVGFYGEKIFSSKKKNNSLSVKMKFQQQNICNISKIATPRETWLDLDLKQPLHSLISSPTNLFKKDLPPNEAHVCQDKSYYC